MRLALLVVLLLPAALRAQSFNLPPSSTTYTNQIPQKVIVTSVTTPSPIPVVMTNVSSVTVLASTIGVVQAGPFNVGQVGVFVVTPSTNAFSINGISSYRTDAYAAPGTGPTVNVSSSPLRTFSIQVTGVGAPATAWDVVLEGSLDGSNFTSLLNHTESVLGDGQTLFSGTNLQPILYYRSRVVVLTLGGASAVSVTVLGVQ